MKDSFFYPAVISIIFILITIPLITKIRATPPGYMYTYSQGYYLDYDYYLSLMRQGRRWWWVYPVYTTEHAAATVIQILYVYLGKIAFVTGLPNVIVYYLAKYAFIIFFCTSLYLLLSLFFSGKWRRIAFLLILFSSSLPPIQLLGGKLSFIDPYPWWVPFGSALHRVTTVPHHLLSLALVMVTLYFWLRFRQKKKRSFLAAALILQAIGILNFPPPGVVLAGGIGIFSLLTWGDWAEKGKIRVLFPAIIFLLISFLSFLVIYWQTKYDPSWGAEFANGSRFFRQSLPIPTILSDYGSVFGLLWLFIIGALGRLKSLPKPGKLIVFLFLAPFILIPITALVGGDSYRIASNGAFIWVGILTTYSCIALESWLKGRFGKRKGGILGTAVVLLAFLVSLPGFLYYYKTELQIEWKTSVYIPKEWIEGLTFLQKTASPGSIVLSREHVGALVPMYTDLRPFLAHRDLTKSFSQKEEKAFKIYTNTMSVEDAKTFLKDNHIDYVYWGWYESDLGKEPVNNTLLTKIFHKGNVSLYRVN